MTIIIGKRREGRVACVYMLGKRMEGSVACVYMLGKGWRGATVFSIQLISQLSSCTLYIHSKSLLL